MFKYIILVLGIFSSGPALFAQEIDLYTPLIQYSYGNPIDIYLSSNIGIVGEKLFIGSTDNYQLTHWYKQAISYACIEPTGKDSIPMTKKRTFGTRIFFRKYGLPLIFYVHPNTGETSTLYRNLGFVQKYHSGTFDGVPVRGNLFFLREYASLPTVSCQFNQSFSLSGVQDVSLHLHIQPRNSSTLSLNGKSLTFNNDTSKLENIMVSRLIDVLPETWKVDTSIVSLDGKTSTGFVANGASIDLGNIHETLRHSEGISLPKDTESIVIHLKRK